MSDKLLEKIVGYAFSLGPATIFVIIAVKDIQRYLASEEPGNLWKAFGFLVLAGLWGYGTQKLKELVEEIWQKQRSPLADSLIKRSAKVNQRLWWKLSNFEQQYLECQAYECYDYRVEGYTPFGIKMLMLEEVFVPLELVGSQLDDIAQRMVLRQQGKSAKAKTELEDLMLSEVEQKNTWKIWDFLAQTENSPTYRRMAILAAVGYGKTTLLKHITLSYAKQLSVVHQFRAPKLIPILIYLRELRELFNQEKQNYPSLPELIHIHHLPRLPKPEQGQLDPPDDDWAANVLQAGRALVMFDGFDEVAETRRGDVSEWMTEEMRRYPRSVFILTSRPPGYEKHFTAEKLDTMLYVRAFNDEQRQEFVHKWYACQERYDRGGRSTPDVIQRAEQNANSLLQQLEKRPKLSAMADNPLLLNMIATFHRFHPGDDLPKYRAALYADICKLQLTDRPRAKGIPMLLNLEQNLQLLQLIAMRMTDMLSGRMTSAAGEVLRVWIRQPLSLLNYAVSPDQWIEQIVEVSELLVEKETNLYEFAHLSFQEYLAAAQIKASQDISILLNHFEESEWRETILLYAAQTDPTPLVEEACRRDTREALQLGYDCIRESPNLVNPEVFETLQTQRYQPLETYLSQGNWQEADKETLKMMLRTVGKGENQYLTPDELLTFPCDDLLRIDRLWVDHSDGRFGFSVQKDIYLECGGIPDGQYDEEAFKKFGDRVMWREKNKWTFSINYDMASPKGHLPTSINFSRKKRILFSRIAHCKL
jgi:hypothetical protein